MLRESSTDTMTLGAGCRYAVPAGDMLNDSGAASMSALKRANAGAGAKAWYWVEVLPYDTASAVTAGPAQTFAPDSTRPNIYRITAVAQGLKPGTQAVVQSVFVWKKVSS